MTGAELIKFGKELANRLGYGFWHFNDRRAMPRGAIGVSDCIAIGRGRVVFAEIKGEGDKIRPEQEWFAEYCRSVGGNVIYVLVQSPEDWERVLNG